MRVVPASGCYRSFNSCPAKPEIFASSQGDSSEHSRNVEFATTRVQIRQWADHIALQVGLEERRENRPRLSRTKACRQ